MKQAVCVFFLLCLQAVQAQSFGTGVLVTDLHAGIEVYDSELRYHRSGAQIADTLVNRLMGNATWNAGLEVGLHKRLGLGLRGRLVAFYRALDEVTNQRPDINTSDLLLMVNYHPVVKKNFDLVLGAELGLSRLKIDLNDLENAELRSNGSFTGLYINPRFYHKRVGFNVKAYYPMISFRKMIFSEDDSNSYRLSSWRGSGFGLSLGFQIRLF